MVFSIPSASVLGGTGKLTVPGFKHFYRASGNASEVIEKSTGCQGLLYCCTNAGVPSLFSMGRTTIDAIYEGTVRASDISIDTEGANITITKALNKQLYVDIIGY